MVTRHGSEPVTEVEPGVISFDGRLFDWWPFVSDPGASIASRS
jgi:hypothetical protein